ncbi:MAG: methylamine utilization protein, partial [Burkholderiaceae bacterium]|nr:methylamine utilization protein [Burkholderiaceae bacterium]
VRDAVNGQPLDQAVVYLESADARRQVRPMQGVTMAQQKKQFVPAVLVATVGTEVQFPNLDAVRHHVYSFSAAKKFEIKLYKGKDASPVLFDQPGVVLLGCNIHDNMVGWIVVVDTPHHAQTGVDGTVPGRVRLDGVPAGSYQLRVWHPRQPVGDPALQQALQVPATGEVTATVRMAGLQP